MINKLPTAFLFLPLFSLTLLAQTTATFTLNTGQPGVNVGTISTSVDRGFRQVLLALAVTYVDMPLSALRLPRRAVSPLACQVRLMTR